MPKASKVTASESVRSDGYEGHFENFEGGYTVGFEAYAQHTDPSPYFAGLPDDRCQCPHWGYVISGRMKFRYHDRVETYQAGDAYFAPPGHTPELYAGTEIVEFSPTEELRRTVEVVDRNIEEAG